MLHPNRTGFVPFQIRSPPSRASSSTATTGPPVARGFPDRPCDCQTLSSPPPSRVAAWPTCPTDTGSEEPGLTGPMDVAPRDDPPERALWDRRTHRVVRLPPSPVQSCILRRTSPPHSFSGHHWPDSLLAVGSPAIVALPKERMSTEGSTSRSCLRAEAQTPDPRCRRRSKSFPSMDF
jgi:hypothetical protein